MTEGSFVNKLKKLLQDDGYSVKSEVGVGFGIADLVLVKNTKFNLKNVALRESYKQRSRLLNEDYFKVLHLLPDQHTKQTVHISYLEKNTKISNSILKYKILKRLENKKFIKRVNKDYYFKANGWLPLAREVIAIEAKLKDWKRGIYQVNRYKSFADRVYLAIPSETQRLVDKEMLKKYNVGLLTLDYKKGLKKIAVSAPKGIPLNENKKNYAIEFFWNSEVLKQITAM